MDQITDEERRRIAELVAEGAPPWKLHQEINRSRRAIRRVKRAADGPFVHSIDGLVARRRPSVQPHRTGIAVGIGSADGTTSRWVMEKAGENARRAAAMGGQRGCPAWLAARTEQVVLE